MGFALVIAILYGILFLFSFVRGLIGGESTISGSGFFFEVVFDATVWTTLIVFLAMQGYKVNQMNYSHV